MADQILQCVGELQIRSPISYEYSKGTIRFIGPFESDLGQIRASGFGGFGVMIADVSGLSSGGFNVRTSTIQGDSSVGGSGEPYPFTVQSNKTTMAECLIGPRSSSNASYTSVMNVQRPLSGTSTWNESNLATFSQNQIRSGEQLFLNIKGGYSALQTCLGSIYPDGDSSSSSNSRAFLGVRTSTSEDIIKALQIDKLGNVTIPIQLTATTINATTYLNLPPVPAGDLLPITLDQTNNRVGINTVTPTVAFEVNGDALFGGDVTIPETSSLVIDGLLSVLPTTGVVDIETPNIEIKSSTGDIKAVTVESTNWVGLPTVDLTPLTLDNVNNRVGVNTIVPTEAVDVTGNILASGSITGATLGGTLSTAAQTNVTSLGTLSSLTVTGDVTIDSTTLKVDSTNNRVGINTSSPIVPFEVVGNAWTRGDHTVDGYMKADAVTVGFIPSVKEGWAMYRDSSTLTLYVSPLNTSGVPDSANDVSIQHGTGKVTANYIDATTVKGTNWIGLPSTAPTVTMVANTITTSNFSAAGAPAATPPTKATTRIRDTITVIDDGSGWCRCQGSYLVNNGTGVVNGIGAYVFALPSPYQFKVTYGSYGGQPTWTSGNFTPSSYDNARMIPASGSYSTRTAPQVAQILTSVIPTAASEFVIVMGTGTTRNMFASVHSLDCSIAFSFLFEKI